MKLKKLVLTSLAVNTVVTVARLIATQKFVKETEMLLASPLNKSYIEVISVENKSIMLEEADHVNGYAINAQAYNQTITISRALKSKSYYKAVLDHEVGHIVYAPQLTIFSSKMDLIKCELKADEYSVKQGNLEELIKFRSEFFRKTWFAPVQYNTVCLAKLLAIKYLKK